MIGKPTYPVLLHSDMKYTLRTDGLYYILKPWDMWEAWGPC